METSTTTQMEPPKVEPQKEHEWLTRLAGEWTAEGEMMMPDQPPMKFKGTERARSIGSVWLLIEGEGDAPGGGVHLSIMTLGYDPQKQKFVGSFIASMGTNIWIYEGSLDASGKVLTLDTEGPSMTQPGKMAKYKDAIEIKSNDERVMTSRVLGDDGKWTQLMSMTSRRKK